jgi:hypothetical protein
MTLILKGAPLDINRRLIRCLATDNKYRGVMGRIEVEADDAYCFVTELGV